MLKRLALVALFTGSAQLATLLALKYLIGYMDAAGVKALGEVDSLINFIVNVIALGLLMSTVRNVAISSDWGKEIDLAQQARLTLGLLLMPLALWGLFDHNYLIFLFAPVFALQADYALYGRSYPVLAAIIALVRVVVPYLAIMVTLHFNAGYLIQAFFFSSVAIYFVIGIFITRFLHRPYWLKPSFKSLKLYWKSLDLGIASLSYYFLGLGIITIAANFYDNTSIAVAYVGCKVYMIFKGVLRIISQSFVKEMLNSDVQLQVDRLAGFAGFIFLTAVLFYPSSFISIFLNKGLDFDKGMLIILALSGLLAAILLSYPNKAILEKRDRPYSIISATAALASIALCIILSYFSSSPRCIFISILAGEFLNLLGLVKLCGTRQSLASRMVIWSRYLLMMTIPLLVRVYWGDSPTTFFAGMGMMAAVFLLLFRKKLRL